MKSKILYYFPLLILLNFSVYQTLYAEIAKDSIADNMLSVVDSLNKINQPKEMYVHASRLLAYALDNKLEFYIGESNKYIGAYFTIINKLDSAYLYYKKAAHSYASISDSAREGKVYLIMAYKYYINNKSEEAFYYYKKALDKLKNTEEYFWKGLVNDNIGFLSFEQGNYFDALKYYQDALPEFLAIEKYENVGRIYDKMALVYRKTNDTDKEEEAYMSAIHYLSKIDTTVVLGLVYNNLSEIYFGREEIEKGLETLEKAKKIYLSLDYQKGLCSYYSVMASYYSNLIPPDNEKVIVYCNLSLPIAEEYEDFRQYADATSTAGEAYLRMNQPTKAINICTKGYEYADEYQLRPEKLILSQILSRAYKQLGNLSKALLYLEIHIALNDSILNEEKIKEFTQLDMSFKFRQQQINDSINQLQKDQVVKFEHEQELRIQKQAKLIFIFATILIIIIALFILLYARRSKKQAATLNEKNLLINQSLEEKELLLKEIHHRVKNSFQLVSSLLELQSKEVFDEKAVESIQEGQERVRAMALIHQKLYQNKNLTNIDFNKYTTLLIKEIAGIYPISKNVATSINIVDMHFDIDTAIPLGLILNELITNAFKYAFAEKENNSITVSIARNSDNNYILTFRDSGIGLPDNIDIKKTKSLGLRLITRLAKQLHGKMTYRREGGTAFNITFKDTNQRRFSD